MCVHECASSLVTLLRKGAQFGRDAFRRAITQRLIPSLRAFNPDLILLSSGFDAAKGDVGNRRDGRRGGVAEGDDQEVGGMDLLPEDFAWMTAEIMKIGDLCCGGKVVSVLEGGYGRPDPGKMGSRMPLSEPSLSTSKTKSPPLAANTPSPDSSDSKSSSLTPPASSPAALERLVTVRHSPHTHCSLG